MGLVITLVGVYGVLRRDQWERGWFGLFLGLSGLVALVGGLSMLVEQAYTTRTARRRARSAEDPSNELPR